MKTYEHLTDAERERLTYLEARRAARLARTEATWDQHRDRGAVTFFAGSARGVRAALHHPDGGAPSYFDVARKG